MLLMLNAETVIPGVVSSVTFAVCQFFVARHGGYPRNAPTRREAAEATRIYGQAIHLLTHATQPEAVGPLADILWLPDMTGYVPNALYKLLPLLEPEHAPLLNAKQRDSLMRILTESGAQDLELQRATVRAMGKIGDVRTLPIMEQLADGAWGASDSSGLREDAGTALCKLQKRVHPHYIGRNLLRASQAPATSPEELLRPATGSSETPPGELLRAHDAP